KGGSVGLGDCPGAVLRVEGGLGGLSIGPGYRDGVRVQIMGVVRLGTLRVFGRDDQAALVPDPGPGVAVSVDLFHRISAGVQLGGDDVAVRVDDLVGAIPLVEARFRGSAQGIENVGSIAGGVVGVAGDDGTAVQEPTFGDQAILLVEIERGDAALFIDFPYAVSGWVVFPDEIVAKG
ncbi:MAG: hypothetical protein GY849_20505, partial [Deltaproteobacteria bacterium]|nr:hypothetical protein [Deltaproteobacteria bacterium]